MSIPPELVSPGAGPVLVEIACGECGSRRVGLVQRDGRTVTPTGAVLTGWVLRSLFGKVRSAEHGRGLAVSEKVFTLARPGSERTVVCPRHGSLALDMRAVAQAANTNTPKPRVIRAVRNRSV
ncbi:hypothetical protein [Ruania albidiflava]|uniref:hypothetical protein n=1 Tax=Ruania albidiflava TaxID=366586 RepID=UPI0012FA732C|nr:hypothetical protein [Ruania albidiflava]